MGILRDWLLTRLQVIGKCFTLNLPSLLCSLILPAGGLAFVTVLPTRVPRLKLLSRLLGHHEHRRGLSLFIYALVSVFKSQAR